MAGAFGIDPSVIDKLRTFDDYNRAEEEFNFKKQLLQQNALQSQLQNQALIQQATNGGFTPKDMLTMQMQRQNQVENLDFKRQALDQTTAMRQAQMEQNALTRQSQLDAKNTQLQEKKDLKYRTDQNLLGGGLSSIQEQIDRIDRLGALSGKPISGLQDNFGMFQMSNKIAGTDASNAKTDLSNLNANSFIQALGAMKSQSATGASGLGALSEKEGDKVQAAAAALSGDQSYDNFTKNLQGYRDALVASQQRLKSGFDNIYQPQAQPQQSQVRIDPNAARAELQRRGLLK